LLEGGTKKKSSSLLSQATLEMSRAGGREGIARRRRSRNQDLLPRTPSPAIGRHLRGSQRRAETQSIR